MEEVAVRHLRQRSLRRGMAKLRRRSMNSRAVKANKQRLWQRAKRALHDWHVVSRAAAQQRALTVDAAQRVTAVRARQCLRVWSHRTQAALAHRSAMELAAQHHLFARRVWGLRRWRAQCVVQHKLRHQAEVVATRAHRRLLLTRCLQAWRRFNALQQKVGGFWWVGCCLGGLGCCVSLRCCSRVLCCCWLVRGMQHVAAASSRHGPSTCACVRVLWSGFSTAPQLCEHQRRRVHREA